MDISDNYSDLEGAVWLPAFTDLTKSQVRTYALVLDSRGVPCCIEPAGSLWQLLVPEQKLANAIMELNLYIETNKNWPPELPLARKFVENTLPTISVLILVATFHNLNLLGISLSDRGLINLQDLGVADAEKILDGEWWRSITALTLHADITHLLSNITIGGIFIILLCRELGSGLAWTLLLASGTSGNLFNAWIQSTGHRSVGASTAVFGAVGILAAISTVRYRHHLRQRWFVPIAAGLALLAILGTEGKNTDLGAHLFGFCSGVTLGVGAELFVVKFGRPGAILNVVLALFSAILVLLAWWIALSSMA